jgi:hypothetical protein
MTTPIQWPRRQNYERALKQWQTTLFDPELKAGRLLMDGAGNPTGREGAGLYVAVFQIGGWIVRCFCANPDENKAPPDDIIERYQAIDAFCRANIAQLPALVPTYFLEQGIQIGTKVIPIVKMQLLQNVTTMGDFIYNRHRDQAAMHWLANAWMNLITGMENLSLAHGDLDLTNVLVQQEPTGMRLRLVDYDNMFVPALAGHSQSEGGHPPFQNPFIPARDFDATMDRFSALVIYICLRSLAIDSSLYGEFHADENSRLMLDVPDYEKFGLASGGVLRLRRRAIPANIDPYFEALIASLRDKTMPPRLDTIVPVAVPVVNVAPLPVQFPHPNPLPPMHQGVPPPPPPPVIRPVMGNQQQGSQVGVPGAPPPHYGPGVQQQKPPNQQGYPPPLYTTPGQQPNIATQGNVLLFVAILVAIIVIIFIVARFSSGGDVFLQSITPMLHWLFGALAPATVGTA